MKTSHFPKLDRNLNLEEMFSKFYDWKDEFKEELIKIYEGDEYDLVSRNDTIIEIIELLE